MSAIWNAVACVCVSALVIIAIRGLPFIVFRGGRVLKGMAFVERYMPPVAMTVLVVSSFTGIRWQEVPHGIPELAGALATAGLQFWKRNVFLSIFAGTVLYMLLRAFMAAGS
ncbi:MAG: AzlD domain-containing protein [Rectinemataceae bacterium]